MTPQEKDRAIAEIVELRALVREKIAKLEAELDALMLEEFDHIHALTAQSGLINPNTIH